MTGTKITIENFDESDTLEVNGETISGEGDAPPNPAPPPGEPAEYNHFGDDLDNWGGKSLTFRDGLETVHYSNRVLDMDAGQMFDIRIPSDEDTAGRNLTFANGSNQGTLGKVNIYVDGTKVGSGTLQQTGSVGIDITPYAGKTVRFKFVDGGYGDSVQLNCYG